MLMGDINTTVFHTNTLISITTSSRKLSRSAAIGRRERIHLKAMGFVQFATRTFSLNSPLKYQL
jgi:hypothetical protein